MKSASTRSVSLSPNQIVAWNLERERTAKRWSQEDAAKRLEPFIGYRLSRAAWSKAERSRYGGQIRRFDADEILAFARMFDIPVAAFFMVPESHFETKSVVVNAKPGIPKAKVKSPPLSANEMTAFSGKAQFSAGTPDLSGVFGFLWLFAYQTVAIVVEQYLREHPNAVQAVAARDARVTEEVIERIRNKVLTPAQESRLQDEFLQQAGLKTEGKR